MKAHDTQPIPRADADRMHANAHALLAAVALKQPIHADRAGQTFDEFDLERAVTLWPGVDLYLTTDNRYLAWSPETYCDITEAVLAILENS